MKLVKLVKGNFRGGRNSALMHVPLWIPISNNIRDMFWTRLYFKLGQRDLKMVCDTPQSKDASTHQNWDSYLQ